MEPESQNAAPEPGPPGSAPREVRPTRTEARPRNRLGLIQALWESGVDMSGTPLNSYLKTEWPHIRNVLELFLLALVCGGVVGWLLRGGKISFLEGQLSEGRTNYQTLEKARDKEEQEKSRRITQLHDDEVKSLNNTARSLTATIASLEADNGRLRGEIADIKSDIDPGAKAVKKRAKILSDQISIFLSTQETGASKYSWTTVQVGQRVQAIMKGGKSQQEAMDQINLESSKNASERTTYWRAAYRQFGIQYGDRLARIRGQISELGYQTPAIDFMMTNQPDTFTPLADLKIVNFLTAIARELQESSVQIKEIDQPVQSAPR